MLHALGVRLASARGALIMLTVSRPGTESTVTPIGGQPDGAAVLVSLEMPEPGGQVVVRFDEAVTTYAV